MSFLRFGLQVGPGLWLVACALAAPSLRMPAFGTGFFGLLFLSFSFASTADVPRCHHFARLFPSACVDAVFDLSAHVRVEQKEVADPSWTPYFAVSMKDPRLLSVFRGVLPLRCPLRTRDSFLFLWESYLCGVHEGPVACFCFSVRIPGLWRFASVFLRVYPVCGWCPGRESLCHFVSACSSSMLFLMFFCTFVCTFFCLPHLLAR